MKLWQRLKGSRAARTLAGSGGMTLVELVVGMLLLVLLVGVASGIIIAGMNVFSRQAQREQATQIGDAVYGFIEDSLKDAQRVSLTPLGPEGQAGGISIQPAGDEQGRLLCQKAGEAPLDPFGEEFYGGCEVAWRLRVTPDYLAELRVEVTFGGKRLYTRQSAFRLNTMKAAGAALDEALLAPASLEESPASPDVYFI